MQDKKDEELRKAWKGLPCNHPNFDKEYTFGSDSGDYICTTCGKVFTRTQKEQIEFNRH